MNEAFQEVGAVDAFELAERGQQAETDADGSIADRKDPSESGNRVAVAVVDPKVRFEPAIGTNRRFPQPADRRGVRPFSGSERSESATESAVRAGTLGLPMALAIIGGTPEHFVSLVDLFRRSAKESGHDASTIGMGINSHAFIGDDSKKTADEFFPPFVQVMARIGRERGWSPMTREQYEYMISAKGALLIGSPQQVIDKILYEHELFRNNRFLAYMSVGAMPHKKVMRSIELFGNVVAPAIRKAIPSAKIEMKSAV